MSKKPKQTELFGPKTVAAKQKEDEQYKRWLGNSKEVEVNGKKYRVFVMLGKLT